ncbi:unnamed protein product [Agarophyton chilense]
MKSLSVLILFALPLTVLCIQNSLQSHSPLRCCYLEEPPISFISDRVVINKGLNGAIAEHVLQLQSYLGWTCSTMTLFSQTNTSDFNAFVEHMYGCTNMETGEIRDSPDCNCDIGIGGWLLNIERYGKVDFLPPFMFDRYAVFTHVTQATISGNKFFFLLAFDRKAWICIVAVITMFIFLKMLDVRFAVAAPYTPLPETCSRFERILHYLTKGRLLYRLRKATQSAVMRMMLLSDGGVVDNGNTTRQWLLNLFIGVCAIILILSYEASMTASLVQESITSNFRTAIDLQTCRIKPSEVCLVNGGALETLWKRSIALDKCHLQDRPTYFESAKTLFEAVENRKCQYALFLESAITAATRERYCGEFVMPPSNCRQGRPLQHWALI